jgi:hypothetical protein
VAAVEIEAIVVAGAAVVAAGIAISSISVGGKKSGDFSRVSWLCDHYLEPDGEVRSPN